MGKMLDASGGTKQTLGAVTLTRGLLWVQVPTALQQGQTQSKHTMDLPNAAAYIYSTVRGKSVLCTVTQQHTMVFCSVCTFHWVCQDIDRHNTFSH